MFPETPSRKIPVDDESENSTGGGKIRAAAGRALRELPKPFTRSVGLNSSGPRAALVQTRAPHFHPERVQKAARRKTI
jgi:hypothetical protein